MYWVYVWQCRRDRQRARSFEWSMYGWCYDEGKVLESSLVVYWDLLA
jgi:hypothetical protein